MKRNLAIALLSLSLFACKKDAPPAAPKILTPEESCKKMTGFDTTPDPSSMPMCTAILTTVKAKDNAAYECMAKCIDAAKDKSTADACDKQCPAFKTALGMH